jgi:hypothetical protein
VNEPGASFVANYKSSHFAKNGEQHSSKKQKVTAAKVQVQAELAATSNHTKKTLPISYVMMMLMIVIYVRENSLRVDTLNL